MLSLRRQSELLQVNCSTHYYKASEIDQDDVDLLNEIGEIWESSLFDGYRRITKKLNFKRHRINRKRVQCSSVGSILPIVCMRKVYIAAIIVS